MEQIVGVQDGTRLPASVTALGAAIAVMLLAGLVADVFLLARPGARRAAWRDCLRALRSGPWTWERAGQPILLLILANAAVIAWIEAAGQMGLHAFPGYASLSVVAQTLFFQASGIAAAACLARSAGLTVRQAFAGRSRRLGSDVLLGAFFYLAAVPPVAATAAAYRALLSAAGCPVGPQAVVSLLADPQYPLWLQVYLAAVAVSVGPLAEETLFRGVALPLLCRRTGFGTAVVAVSVLFACIHFHLPSAGPLFAMAAAFALAYAYTGSVVVPAVMHALFNGGTLVTLLVLRNASALHLLR